MNENIDLTKILKDCPKGTEFWSDNFGAVKFVNVGTEWDTPIEVELTNGELTYYTEKGWCDKRFPANCLLWPSKDCRDWSKFTAPWYKKGKKDGFDPKTLKAYDKVLVRDKSFIRWRCTFYSHLIEDETTYKYVTAYNVYKYCIPYNDETKHLVGTTDEAPEYYKYWED